MLYSLISFDLGGLNKFSFRTTRLGIEGNFKVILVLF